MTPLQRFKHALDDFEGSMRELLAASEALPADQRPIGEQVLGRLSPHARLPLTWRLPRARRCVP